MLCYYDWFCIKLSCTLFIIYGTYHLLCLYIVYSCLYNISFTVCVHMFCSPLAEENKLHIYIPHIVTPSYVERIPKSQTKNSPNYIIEIVSELHVFNLSLINVEKRQNIHFFNLQKWFLSINMFKHCIIFIIHYIESHVSYI